MNLKNDWIVATMNNPEFTESDFRDVAGFNLKNTLLLPLEEYYNSKKVTSNPMFQTDGAFDKDKFKLFYNYLLEKFDSFAANNSVDSYEYGFWDPLKKADSIVKNPNLNIDKVLNPTHQSTGVIGINLQGERYKSDFELAEKLNIFDWKSRKFLDTTPESSALFTNPFKFIKNILSEPLVLAKYEEDTDEIDPLTGVMIHHHKGENKTNANGEYYFETLGGRSIMGKDVLSIGDILTKEDSAVNKYDFFDGDDLEKSPTGVIAKNLAILAPVPFLGPAGLALYSGFFVAKELGKSMPMINGWVQALGDVTNLTDGNTETPEWINKWAAFGEKWTTGTSEHGKNNTFTFENFGNLIADVALQWGQQKLIANSLVKLKSRSKGIEELARAKGLSEYEKQAASILNKANLGEINAAEAAGLTGAGSIADLNKVMSSGLWEKTIVGQKAIEKHWLDVIDSYSKIQRMGLDLSLVYMALVSNNDVYEQALERGASKNEAALISAISTAAMFGVDKFLGLGEMFFDDELDAQRRLFRKMLSDHVTEDVKPFLEKAGISKTNTVGQQATQQAVQNKYLNLIKETKKSVENFFKDYRVDIKDRGLSLGAKAIGEGLEEATEELVTDISKSMYDLAALYGYTLTDSLGAWENAFDRYTMSFLGGALGGGLFGAYEGIKNPRTVADRNSREELLLLVRQGKTNDILKELSRMRDQGKLGDTTRSMNTATLKNGSRVYLTKKEGEESQNNFVYKQMKSAIELMDKIINGNQLNLTDDQLFERMILSDKKLFDLLTHLKNRLKEASYMSGYFRDFLNLVSEIYDVESKIDDLRKSTSDEDKRHSESYTEELNKLTKKRDKLLLEKEDFFKGKSQRYLKKTLFALNPEISGLFLPPTKEQYSLWRFNKNIEELSDEEQKDFNEEYETYVKSFKVSDLDEAYDIFESLVKRVNPEILELKPLDILEWGKTSKSFREFIPDVNPDYNERINPIKEDVDLILRVNLVSRSEEYDKKWKEDPSKSNKAFTIFLNEAPNETFEIVKDYEEGNWSIHFKTSGPKALSEKLKQRLFLAAAALIPEGDRISTWGFLTKGGVSGINQFGLNGKYGITGFTQVGSRKVNLRTEVPIKFNPSEVPSFENVKDAGRIDREFNILTSKNGTQHPVKIGYIYQEADEYNPEKLEVTILNLLSPFLVKKSDVLNSDIYESYDNLQELGRIKRIIKVGDKWYTEVEFASNADPNGSITESVEGILAPELVPNDFRLDIESKVIMDNTNSVEEIEIPIWEKRTGETDEEYANRNTQLEGESPEQFEERRKERTRRIQSQNNDKIISTLEALIDSDLMIDANTFRLILASLRVRAKDRLRSIYQNFGRFEENGLEKFHPMYDEFQESLSILNDDLSNAEDVKSQIISKVKDVAELELDKIKKEKSQDTFLTEDLPFDEDGYLSFSALVSYLRPPIVNGKSAKYSSAFDLMEADEDNNPLAAQDAFDYVNLEAFVSGTWPDDKVEFLDGYTIERDGKTTQLYKVSTIEDAMIILEGLRQKYRLGLSDEKLVGFSLEVENDFILKHIDPVERGFDEVIEIIKNDKLFNTLSKLKTKLRKDNSPTLKILKLVANKLGENFEDIESTLQTIYEQYDGLADAADFELTDPLIEALEKAQMLLKVALAVVNAASGTDSYTTPFAFNKTINEWNEAHKDEIGEMEKLPELDKDVANVLKQDFGMYSAEIDRWLEKGKLNGINKVKMFKEFDGIFEGIKLKFFMDNRDKWLSKDGTNLLAGYKTFSNPKDLVLEFERVLYKNTQELIRKGVSVNELFEAFKGSINWNLAKTLKTSKLNNNITELTDYDKFIYIITTMGYNADNFYTDYKKFVEANSEIYAPLSFQKHAIRLAKAQENNMEFINDMLSEFLKETKMLNVPILKNVTIITGIGGAGKTDVCARACLTDKTWVSGPTDTQISHLKELGEVRGIDKKELMKLILKDQYDEFYKKDSKIVKPKEDTSFGSTVDISKVEISEDEDTPKTLIIDEITLFSNAEILVLSEWANKNKVHLILIGDESQLGNQDAGKNISRENNIALRVPKLALSLRDGNLWKYLNQTTLASIETSLQDTESKEETTLVAQRILNDDLKKFALKYYYKDGVLTGDMIIEPHLTLDQINLLKNAKPSKEGKEAVKFIGSEQSPVYRQLRDAGVVSKAYSLDKIQGDECEYVVCDISWKNYNILDTDWYNLLSFMQSLYTVITRSKLGSLIVDNGLSDIIYGSKPQSYTTPSKMISKESTKEFTKLELDWINSLDLNPTTDEQKIESKTPITENDPINIPEPGPDDLLTPKKVTTPPEEKINKTPDISEPILPIHVYTNYNMLGIQRTVDDDGKSTWSNPESVRRDVGIFTEADEVISTKALKDEKRNLLLDLKSCFIAGDLEDIDKYNALSGYFTLDSLKKAKYYVVREVYNPLTHHYITIELDLLDLPEGEIIYTLLARVVNTNNELCTITLGVLPTPQGLKDTKTYIKNDIIRERDNKGLTADDDCPENQILNDLDGEIDRFRIALEELEDKENQEIIINTPKFPGFLSLTAVSSQEENKETGEKRKVLHKIRLEELHSGKSRLDTRSEAYVISPIYTDVDKTSPMRGKPYILFSAKRYLSPSELIGIYKNPKLNKGRVRRVYLQSTGIEFESLFDEDKEVRSIKGYHFPFEAGAMGVRMYTALHNFRLRLKQFNQLVTKLVLESFNGNMNELEELLKRESELYTEYSKIPEESRPSSFKNWVNENHPDEKFDIIWDFNEKTLKDVKLFRLGYNSDNGVYVRSISKNKLGNYINPRVAQEYYQSIDNLFTTILDKIVDPKNLSQELLNNYLTYKVEDWAKNFKQGGKENVILFKIEGLDGTVYPVEVKALSNFSAVPLILAKLTRFSLTYLNAKENNKETKVFDNYLSPDSKKAITVDGVALPYLNVFKHLEDSLEGPGIYKNTHIDKGVHDRRLVNMFNVAFHGLVHLLEVDNFTKDDLRADDVMFPLGFFVDAMLLPGKMDPNKDYRLISIDRKFYLIDVAPQTPKVYITLSKYTGEDTVEPDPKDAKLKPKKDSQIDIILKNHFGENVETDTLTIGEINSKLKDDFVNLFKSGNFNSLNELLNCEYRIEEINEKQKIVSIRELFNLTHDFTKVDRYEFDDEKYTIYFNNGLILLLYIDDSGELKLNYINNSENGSENGSENNSLNLMLILIDGIDEDIKFETDFGNDEKIKALKRLKDFISENETLIRKCNNLKTLQKDLLKIFLGYEDIDLGDKVDNIINLIIAKLCKI